jgi:ABC-type Zn uptake system ZnuABC Zn-binding protein ZnuA
VTFHDAFGHFARRHGWRVSAFVSSGAGEVTPEKVVNVMKVMKAEGIPAVFSSGRTSLSRRPETLVSE